MSSLAQSAVTPARVALTPQARGALCVAARASRERERGGILVGYRRGLEVVVEDALTVPDLGADRTTYVRRPRPAAAVLDAYLRHADPLVGYVGEWHTHPEPQPPSGTDHRAMRIMTRRNQDPVAMIVAACLPKGTIELFALLGVPDSWPHRLAGRHVTALVILG